MGEPHTQQVARLERRAQDLLSPVVPREAWLSPFAGAEAGFRNKAKLAVGGTKEAPTFGILDASWQGVDLSDCGLYEPALARALGPLTRAVAAWGLVPYDVSRRTGEFKHLIVTASPDGEIMVRVVLRSPGQLPRVRRGLPGLRAALPHLRVLSVNIQPEHKAVLEGEEEIVLSEHASLPMRLADLELDLGPGGFFQTNSEVAAALYHQARDWVAGIAPRSVLDLYCGIGGFALSAVRATGPATRVLGVEISEEAVAGATRAARAAGMPGERAAFVVGDARVVTQVEHDLVIVNPPRRGLGVDLCEALTRAGPRHILYSSCRARSLADDLRRLPEHQVVAARAFDMFPQTEHVEVMVLAERVTPPRGAGRP